MTEPVPTAHGAAVDAEGETEPCENWHCVGGVCRLAQLGTPRPVPEPAHLAKYLKS